MARVINFFKTIRNNWKKSVAGAAAFSYGVNYSKEYYESDQIMRAYCEEAAKYGDEVLPRNVNPQHITVILNPVAQKRKAKKLFEKYCEPLLHLAGFAVTIIQTQSENEARSILANMNTHTDAIVVAGGDGTLSDVITGIMRKYHDNISFVKNCPIGILPLGKTNRVANTLFYDYEDLEQVRALADATMAIVRGATKLVDVVEVDLLEKNAENPTEPIYAAGAIEWGAWTDAHLKMDKYWYWGFLRRYVTYIFHGLKHDISWDCNGVIHYSDPCGGCSRCYEDQQESTKDRRWWHSFVPRRKTQSDVEFINYKSVKNNNCGVMHSLPISTTELHIATRNTRQTQEESTPVIKLELGPENINYIDYITEGWRRLKGNKTLVDKTLQVNTIEIHPEKKETDGYKERAFYIDNEEFELKPVRLKLLPRSVKMFCPKEV